MQVPKCKSNLGRVKFSFEFTKSFLLGQVFKKFSTLYKIAYEVNAVRLLKHIVQSNNEGMIDLGQYEFLKSQTLKIIRLEHCVFANNFHCKELVVVVLLYQVDFAIGASTYDPQKFKIVKG